MLRLSNLTVLRGECPVVDSVSFDIDQGEVIGLIGPNGAGKTTLMRAALGLIKHSGTSSISSRPHKERGKLAAFMPQSREIAWPVPVETLVTLGRLPHLSLGAAPSETDRAAVSAALDALDLGGYRNRLSTELSGGEQARVLLARALAQDTPLVIADEPIAGLDPAHQIATMNAFENMAAEGRSVLVSIHDLGLAARHCTRLIVMDRGKLIADGAPLDVLTPDLLRDTFGITAFLTETADGLIFLPLQVTA
ncbi:ABC transporter [Marivivens niveibacter]|uniref:ABC transporter n=1 Tax=Marivivens niveibacter TaxID=1930667 RepID=A0A251WWK8_9RHOB|nr:ABC transporter ATP-binding protein [Marivivens niveibacter]OUD08817.1 ABC transporter [Marivivens niveibacter]